MSPVIGKTPSDMRAELSEMERQVALARTADAVTSTPTEVVAQAAGAADLVIEVTIAKTGEEFALVLRGRNGQHGHMVTRSLAAHRRHAGRPGGEGRMAGRAVWCCCSYAEAGECAAELMGGRL